MTGFPSISLADAEQEVRECQAAVKRLEDQLDECGWAPDEVLSADCQRAWREYEFAQRRLDAIRSQQPVRRMRGWGEAA